VQVLKAKAECLVEGDFFFVITLLEVQPLSILRFKKWNEQVG